MKGRLGKMKRVAKRYRPMQSIAIIIFILSGFASPPIVNHKATSVGPASGGTSVASEANVATVFTATKNRNGVRPTPRPTEPRPSSNNSVEIRLGDRISINGSGASVDGNAVRITAGGTYKISGTLKDGQIIVDDNDKKTVELVLNGVDITSTNSAPIYIKRARTTIVTLADGTENRLKDGDFYVIDDPTAQEPNAALFSKGNLILNGNGSLDIQTSYHNGINSKNALDITSGNITVNAGLDGIRGHDYVDIKNGNISVNAGADGIKSNNDVAPEMGFVSIENGTINITSGMDGIQAVTSIFVKGGSVTVSSGGGSRASKSGVGQPVLENNAICNRSPNKRTPANAGGLKARSDIEIEAGTIIVDSSDEGIHTNDRIMIVDGTTFLAAGDHGIHADNNLVIDGGTINVTRSCEGLDSAIIAIGGGNMHIAGSANAISASGKTAGPPPADNRFLTIEGGYVVIDATDTGDGIDVNGSTIMTQGTVIVNGSRDSLKGALHYDREFTVVGGTLLAVACICMSQPPDATSTQNSVALALASVQPAGTLVHIEASDGTDILTFAPMREYQWVAFSSPVLKKGSTYTVYVGGSATGTIVDGVYYAGSYTPGKQIARVKI